jgi:hypothetical protein
MVVNATLNNISAISWRSVLLVEETGSGENHWQTLSHNVDRVHQQRSIKHTHKTSSNTNLTKTVGALRCSGGVSSSCCMHKPNTCILVRYIQDSGLLRIRFRQVPLHLYERFNIQLMTFHEVNTRIDQPMEHDIHRDIRGALRCSGGVSSSCCMHKPNTCIFRTQKLLLMTFGLDGFHCNTHCFS